MENSYLSHHGIKGQKWGVRRYQNEDGSLTPAGKIRYGNLNKGEREYVIDNNTFTRFSDKRERSVRNSSYVLSTKYDYRHYKEDAEDYKLGNKGKELYEITIKRHGNAKVAEASTTISDLMTELSKKDTKTREEQKALKTYRRLDKAGFFNEKLSVNDRYDVLLNTLSPKGIEHVDYLLKKATNKVGDKEDYAQKKRNAFAEQAHNQVYANRDAFAAKYRDKGYSMIVDPEDYIYNYERPYIIVDKRKFTVSSTKKLKHSEGGLDMTYDELVHTLFSEEPPKDDHLEHHGILGQKWGVRRFQNEDGSLTPAGRERYQKGLAKELQETFKRHGPLAPISSNIKNLAEGNKVYGRYVEAFAATDNFLKSRRERLKADKEYAKTYAKPYFERERDLAQGLANSQEALDKMISVIDQDERSASWVNDSHLADEVIFFNEGDEWNKLWKEEAQAYGDWREEQNRIAKEALGKYGDVKLRSTWDGKKYEQTAQDFLSFALGLADVDPSINNGMDYRKILGHSLESDDHLEHHGILGQKWGKKNGPPYPLDENDHSAAEKKLNKFTPSGVVAKYKDHKKKVQRQKALKKARATKAANAEAKKAAEEHEAAKQKALQSANAKEIMKYRDELTDAEMRDAVARIGWDETLRKKVKEQNPDAIDKAMKVVDKYSGYAKTVGDAAGNLSKIYNNVAKAMNAFTDSEWPIIGDAKPTENDVVKDAEAVKQAILKTKNDTEQYRQNQERTKQEQEKTEQESEKTAQERYKTAQEKARSEQQENTADDKQETTEAKNEKQEKEEKRDWTVDDKPDTSSSSTSSAPKKETVIDAEFKDVTPERAEEAGRLAVERYLQLEDKRKG